MPVDIAGPPFHDLVPPGAAIDEDGDASGQHDEEPGDRHALRAQHFALVEVAQRSVAASHASSSRGAAASVLCAASRSTRSVPVTWGSF